MRPADRRPVGAPCPIRDEQCQPSCPWWIEETHRCPGGCAVTVMARLLMALARPQGAKKPRLVPGGTPQ